MQRIITKCVMDMESLRWIPELEESCPYSGQWEMCLGGASGADKALAKDQKQFADALQLQQGTEFAGEQADLNAISAAWSPIISAGPNQYGFSTAEDQQLRENIVNAGATATTNTENAALLREQQASGGAGAGPSGGTAALNAEIAATGAQSTATALGQEKELGYETGRSEFNTAQAGEAEVAKIENPVGGASAASGAAEQANKSQNLVDTANANSLGAKLLGGAIAGGLSLIPGVGPVVAGGFAKGFNGGAQSGGGGSGGSGGGTYGGPPVPGYGS